MECCFRWPGLNPIEMVWDELDCRVKEKQPTRAQHVGTPSRLLEKHSRWSWLRECQECAKLSRQRVATFKNLKYILMCFTRFGYYMIPCVLFHSFDVFTIILNQHCYSGDTVNTGLDISWSNAAMLSHNGLGKWEISATGLKNLSGVSDRHTSQIRCVRSAYFCTNATWH